MLPIDKVPVQMANCLAKSLSNLLSIIVLVGHKPSGSGQYFSFLHAVKCGFIIKLGKMNMSRRNKYFHLLLI